MSDAAPSVILRKLNSPPSTGQRHEAVTPSDVTEYDPPFQALWVGTAGDVAIEDVFGTSVTYVGVPAGSILPMGGVKVLSTGTDASDIVAMYGQ